MAWQRILITILTIYKLILNRVLGRVFPNSFCKRLQTWRIVLHLIRNLSESKSGKGNLNSDFSFHHFEIDDVIIASISVLKVVPVL